MDIIKKSLIPAITLVILILGGCQSSCDITVTSYNIHHGQGSDGKLDLDRIANVIKQSKADIVILNEVDNHYSRRSDNKDQAGILAKSLGMNMVFGPSIFAGEQGVYGNAILSKYPIISSTTHKLAKVAGTEQRSCLEIQIQIPRQIITVFGTHLDHTSERARIAQIEQILEIINAKSEPTILAGDMNAHPASKTIAMIKEKMTDAEAVAIEKTTGATYLGKNNERIDYIFISNDLMKNIKIYQVIKNETTEVASDHLPIKAMVRIE